ncbi:Hpt domain-containing protein [Maritimibacter sp. HL-12]|uniref:Hpt domain-containing protein n=1 Tax=Maritimibacter sp. HL-12 TaxID=1162418 RepID=UPI001593E46F|nr:Hpt domain-containing protein [Maritimibacter sp. HL-12]
MERDQRPQPVGEFQDPDAWMEACEVFGEDGALSRLRIFCKELADHLDRIENARPGNAALRDMAHRAAGRAGMFGFLALASASADLDEAARHDRGVALALERWMQQAQRVAKAVPE